VTACTKIAIATAATSHFRNSTSLFGIMSSIKYLRDNGATKLAALLITINNRPVKTRLRLGQIIVLNALRIVTFFSAMVLVSKEGAS